MASSLSLEADHSGNATTGNAGGAASGGVISAGSHARQLLSPTTPKVRFAPQKFCSYFCFRGMRQGCAGLFSVQILQRCEPMPDRVMHDMSSRKNNLHSKAQAWPCQLIEHAWRAWQVVDGAVVGVSDSTGWSKTPSAASADEGSQAGHAAQPPPSASLIRPTSPARNNGALCECHLPGGIPSPGQRPLLAERCIPL